MMSTMIMMIMIMIIMTMEMIIQFNSIIVYLRASLTPLGQSHNSTLTQTTHLHR
jgi:hypothetical protein